MAVFPFSDIIEGPALFVVRRALVDMAIAAVPIEANALAIDMLLPLSPSPGIFGVVVRS